MKNCQITIFNSRTIYRLPWPSDEQASHARDYLAPIVKEGPSLFIDNANVEMLALLVDSSVLPLVLSNEKSGNADICSSYAHYILYTLEEMTKRNRSNWRTLLTAMVGSAATLVRAAHLDKVVFVNNWLFSTNPSPTLSSGQIREITHCLTQNYPQHTIVFRSINKRLHKSVFDALLTNQYKMVPSRTVYIADPWERSFERSKNVKHDLRLLKRGGYAILDSNEINDSDIPRIVELYRDLYLKKHSSLNPQLNERYFKLTLKGNLITFQALRRDGRIDAFSACYTMNRVATWFLAGDDIGMRKELGLYRQAFALFINEAVKRPQIMNLSAGAGSFKMLRGAAPYIEYDAVYDRHLPYQRRIAWYIIKAGGVFQHPRFSRLK
jgi:hypothetical protein